MINISHTHAYVFNVMALNSTLMAGVECGCKDKLIPDII